MGWITVAIIVGCLLAASVFVVWKSALRWWEYLVVFCLTVALVSPIYRTITGDVSAWLPPAIWSDGFDGKDQIIIASIASTVLIPLIIATGAVWLVKRVLAPTRPKSPAA